MRFACLLLSFGLCALLVIPSAVQQTASSSSTQASQLLQQSLAALQGNTSLSDVTLSGTARRIAGSDDETGSVVVKALTGTGTRIDLSLPSGTRSELRNISSGAPVGSWSGPDGVSHPISYHNLLTDSGWFPAFTLSSLLSAPNAVISYIGAETKNGISVIHVRAYQQPAGLTGDAAALPQHLTQTDIFLDPNSNLPVALAFNTHPDNNALLDIPIEIRFTDYRSVSGAQVPYHVQKYLNNSLILDFQVQTVTFNTGLTTSSFSL